MLRPSLAVICLLTASDFLVRGEVRILASTESQNLLQGKVGGRVDVACSSTDGSPVSWRYEEGDVQSDERHLVRSLNDDGSISQLTILNAQLNDSGTYRCRSQRKNHENDYITISITADESEDSSYTDHDFTVEIVSPPDDALTVDVGKSFTLRCVGYDGSNLSWFHNGTRLTRSRQVVITSSLEISDRRRISLLTRSSVQSAAGSYECRDLMRTHLGDSVTIHVQRPRKSKVPVEIFQPPLKLHRVRVGTDFKIECRANISSDLIWYFNDTQRLVDDGYSVLILHSLDRVMQQDMTTLQVTNATKKHSGKYSCCNQKDSEDNDYVMIVVDDEREDSGLSFESGMFPVVPTSVIVRIGSVTNLQCSFQAPGDYRLEWTKDGRILTNGEKYVIHQDLKANSLGIRFTDRSDVGIYKCTFNYISLNKTAGIVVFNVTTIPCPSIEPPRNGHFVQCPPQPVFGESCSFGCNHGYQISNSTPVVCERNQTGQTYWSKDIPVCVAKPDVLHVPTTTSNVLLRIGSSLKLQCSGSTVWTKHNQAIENGSKYMIETNSLTIQDIDRSDVGIYVCSIYANKRLIGMNVFNVTSLFCPNRPILPHGDVKGCSEKPAFGEFCVFRCHAGYTLHGHRLTSCELTDNETTTYWTGNSAECLVPPTSSFSRVNSAISCNIPAKLCIFEKFVVFRLDQQRILTVVSSAVLLIPHFLRWRFD